MASTKTLQNVIDFAVPFLNFRSVNLGTANEPAVTSANTVLQTILSPPFTWAWNRKVVSITTVAGTQDYAQTVSDFGFMENGTVTTAGGISTEISNVRRILPVGSSVAAQRGRPDYISANLDNNAGSITFRLQPVPDAVYTVAVAYQIKPVLITGTSSTWAPVPDEYSFIYNYGFLGMVMMYADDPRFLSNIQLFRNSLIGVAEGLDQTQKNIFLETGLINRSTYQSVGQAEQQGVEARR